MRVVLYIEELVNEDVLNVEGDAVADVGNIVGIKDIDNGILEVVWGSCVDDVCCMGVVVSCMVVVGSCEVVIGSCVNDFGSSMVVAANWDGKCLVVVKCLTVVIGSCVVDVVNNCN